MEEMVEIVTTRRYTIADFRKLFQLRPMDKVTVFFPRVGPTGNNERPHKITLVGTAHDDIVILETEVRDLKI